MLPLQAKVGVGHSQGAEGFWEFLLTTQTGSSDHRGDFGCFHWTAGPLG